jgi:hypothetical protein
MLAVNGPLNRANREACSCALHHQEPSQVEISPAIASSASEIQPASLKQQNAACSQHAHHLYAAKRVLKWLASVETTRASRGNALALALALALAPEAAAVVVGEEVEEGALAAGPPDGGGSCGNPCAACDV